MATIRLKSLIPMTPSELNTYLAQCISTLGTYAELSSTGVRAVIPPVGSATLLGTGLTYDLQSGFPHFTGGTLKSMTFSYFGLDVFKIADLNLSAAGFYTAVNSSTLDGIAYLLSKDDVVIGGRFMDVAYTGQGNDKAFGGLGNDSLYGYIGSPGGDGNDSLYGGGGRDFLDGGSGNDQLYGGKGTNVILSGQGNDRAYGGDAMDTIIGDEGNDSLYGGGSLDSMWGEKGNDRMYGGSGIGYISGGLGADLIYGGNESDTILGDDGKDQLFGGGGIDTLDGGNQNDRMFGGLGNDTVYGGAGNDSLRGGAGADNLYGGSGNDQFIFDTALTLGNIDYVDDFTLGQDKIVLDKSVFAALAGIGALSAAQLRIGTAAADANDRIIYDSSSGHLSYDADGAGGKAAVLFATLDTGLALSGSDFQIIA